MKYKFNYDKRKYEREDGLLIDKEAYEAAAQQFIDQLVMGGDPKFLIVKLQGDGNIDVLNKENLKIKMINGKKYYQDWVVLPGRKE
ncbi:MAG: hypothetical protein IH843_05100 [Thaumarchaeota archaeon]|nr:hypothetical protein [Nitrososphaerota archaeon]